MFDFAKEQILRERIHEELARSTQASLSDQFLEKLHTKQPQGLTSHELVWFYVPAARNSELVPTPSKADQANIQKQLKDYYNPEHLKTYADTFYQTLQADSKLITSLSILLSGGKDGKGSVSVSKDEMINLRERYEAELRNIPSSFLADLDIQESFSRILTVAEKVANRQGLVSIPVSHNYFFTDRSTGNRLAKSTTQERIMFDENTITSIRGITYAGLNASNSLTSAQKLAELEKMLPEGVTGSDAFWYYMPEAKEFSSPPLSAEKQLYLRGCLGHAPNNQQMEQLAKECYHLSAAEMEAVTSLIKHHLQSAAASPENSETSNESIPDDIAQRYKFRISQLSPQQQRGIDVNANLQVLSSAVTKAIAQYNSLGHDELPQPHDIPMTSSKGRHTIDESFFPHEDKTKETNATVDRALENIEAHKASLGWQKADELMAQFDEQFHGNPSGADILAYVSPALFGGNFTEAEQTARKERLKPFFETGNIGIKGQVEAVRNAIWLEIDYMAALGEARLYKVANGKQPHSPQLTSIARQDTQKQKQHLIDCYLEGGLCEGSASANKHIEALDRAFQEAGQELHGKGR